MKLHSCSRGARERECPSRRVCEYCERERREHQSSICLLREREKDRECERARGRSRSERGSGPETEKPSTVVRAEPAALEVQRKNGDVRVAET